MGRVVQVLGIVLAAVVLAIIAVRLRRRREPTPPPEIAPVDRRSFLNRVLLGSLAFFAVALGGGSLAVLWPEVRTGIGSKIIAGKLSDILAELKLTKRPVYNVAGRFYLVPYDTSDAGNMYVRAGVATAGIMAIWQKCPHLGCRVPFCPTSGWFECPCHSARFNLAGEWKFGPAPAGMWRLPIEVRSNGDVVVDTRQRIAQPHKGVDTLRQQPAGAFCVPD